MTLRLLLDACIWVDAYVGEGPGHDESKELIDLCLETGSEIYAPSSAYSNVYYVCAKSLKDGLRNGGHEITRELGLASQEAAYGCLKNMQELATAVGMDGSDIWLAMKYKYLHNDFEDDLILAAMERSKADYLVTNDLDLVKHCPFAAMSAKDMASYLREFS